MRIRYFEGTDTLLIEFSERRVAETRDLDEDTLLDVDARGNVCAMTIEHASQRTGTSIRTSTPCAASIGQFRLFRMSRAAP